MKKIFVILTAIICGLALILSCEENITTPPDDIEKNGNRFEQRVELFSNDYGENNNICAYYDGENVVNVKYKKFEASESGSISDEDIVKRLVSELRGENLENVNNPDPNIHGYISFRDLKFNINYEIVAFATFEDGTTKLCRDTITTNEGYHESTGPKPDNSLAGLVSLIIGYRIVEASASYAGVALEGLYSVKYDYSSSYIDVYKVSDTEIGLYSWSIWDEDVIDISVPVIALSGEREHVTFDATCRGVQVGYNGVEYTSDLTVEGWIRKAGYSKSSENSVNATDIATPDFDCEIHMVFDDVDGKVLDFTILAIAPF